MSVFSDIADYHWLTGSEAAAVLQELASSSAPLHTAVARLRRSFSAERTHLLIEQIELRRRAAAKFSAADRMFFTRTALEQATDEHIARYKATRFAAQADAVAARATDETRAVGFMPTALPTVDLCCGIGGDLLALAAQCPVKAVDFNPVATHLAAANLLVTHPHVDAQIHAADVTTFDLDHVAAWHIDPDRRATGRRTTSLDACQPDRAVLDRLLQRVPHAAIKLAPATKVPAEWAARCELEWISRGGECRQLVAWHGDLTRTSGQHRATIVAKDGNTHAPRSLVGTPQLSVPVASQVCTHIFDVDPAVLAARLQGALAAEHGLAALSAAGPTYLTGDVSIADPALVGFHVAEVLPLRTKALAAYLRDRRIGQLEIKKRGVDVGPQELRNELRPRGDNAATLLITPVAGRPAAVVAQRM